jgi:hypothetical protein
MLRIVSTAILLGFFLTLWGCSEQQEQPLVEKPTASVKMRTLKDGTLLVKLSGPKHPEVMRIGEMDNMQEYLSGMMPVRVADVLETDPPLLGEYRIELGHVTYQSRFPIQPGITYRAQYEDTVATFTKPDEKADDEQYAVSRVYPTESELPANLLKFYIEFTGPMSRGYGYQFIKLFDQDGNEVVDPFPAIGVELWDPNQTQFTLLLDPGRIKRGIEINESMGLPLEPGKSYRLVVDGAWPDAKNRPMGTSHFKEFRVLEPDHGTPDVREWLVNKPPQNTSEPIHVEFNEPMDFSLAETMVWIEDVSGNILEGNVELSEKETRWTLTPSDHTWMPGKYAVHVHSRYEDLAGNQIEKPFEVDVESQPARVSEIQTFKIPFTIP